MFGNINMIGQNPCMRDVAERQIFDRRSHSRSGSVSMCLLVSRIPGAMDMANLSGLPASMWRFIFPGDGTGSGPGTMAPRE